MNRARRIRRSSKWTRVSRIHRALHPRCTYCDATTDLTVDHIVPLERGGAAYDPRNLQTLCRPCNSAKGDSLSAAPPRRPPPVVSPSPGTPPFPFPDRDDPS